MTGYTCMTRQSPRTCQPVSASRHLAAIFFFFVVRLFKTYSLGNFQVYNAVLLMTITMLHIRSLELISLLTEFINLPQPQPRQTTSPCRCEFAFLRLHI